MNQNIKSKVKQKKLNGQSKEIIFNVLKFMEEEAMLNKNKKSDNDFLIPLQQVQRRCSKATGVSVSAITRIKKEAEGIFSVEAGPSSFHTPDKKRKRQKPVTTLDSFDSLAVRRMVHNFYLTEKTVPTVKKLINKLKQDLNWKGGETSLRTILHDLGFQWVKTSNNRKMLLEKEDIVAKRIAYLKAIKTYRHEKRSIIYLDESYVLTSHSARKSWEDGSSKGVHPPVSKGDRIIIIHAGGENGFIPNALLTWIASSKKGDYHDNMNQGNFEKWVTDKLITNLPPNSVIILDNAPYHCVKKEKIPTMANRKLEMQVWLQKREICFEKSMFKAELLELINASSPAVTFTLDTILQESGHSVLRLPPYHPDLNPIELVWGILKNWVAAQNVTYKATDIIGLIKEKVACIGADTWSKCCRRVVEIEEDLWSKECAMDTEVDKLIINLNAENTSSSSDETVSDTEDEVSPARLSGVEEMDS